MPTEPEVIARLRELLEAMEDFTPTSDAINALPDSLRSYICDLESRCDPAGDLAARRLTEDSRDALLAEYDKLQRENAELRQSNNAMLENVQELTGENEDLCERPEAMEREETGVKYPHADEQQ